MHFCGHRLAGPCQHQNVKSSKKLSYKHVFWMGQIWCDVQRGLWGGGKTWFSPGQPSGVLAPKGPHKRGQKVNFFPTVPRGRKSKCGSKRGRQQITPKKFVASYPLGGDLMYEALFVLRFQDCDALRWVMISSAHRVESWSTVMNFVNFNKKGACFFLKKESLTFPPKVFFGRQKLSNDHMWIFSLWKSAGRQNFRKLRNVLPKST